MTDKQLSFIMLDIHNKQVNIYSNHLLKEYSKGMVGKIKTKLTNQVESSKAYDDFMYKGFEEQSDTVYELSARMSEILRYLVKYPELARDTENAIIECLKQEKKL